jgi:hypothetical protein
MYWTTVEKEKRKKINDGIGIAKKTISCVVGHLEKMEKDNEIDTETLSKIKEKLKSISDDYYIENISGIL